MRTDKTVCPARQMIAIFLLLGLGGCNWSMHDLGTPPQLSPIDQKVPIEDIIVPEGPEIIYGPDRISMTDNSIWNKEDGIYFRDTRAFEVGDILTVNIEMNDSARLDNKSGKETSVTGGLTGTGEADLHLFTIPTLTADGSLSADLDVERGGTVDRTETIRLQVAAAVIAASANGNLHIVGSQEVRVNHELRILTVRGVVRSKDILPDNTIPYEKIAEARISYGGHNTRNRPHRRRWWQLSKYPGPLGYTPEN